MPLPLLALAGIAGGTKLAGDVIGGVANYYGGKASARELKKANEANRKLIKGNYDTTMALEQPYQATGTQSLADLNKLISSGELYKQFESYGGPTTFDPNSVDVTKDPGYAFRLQEGQKALDASAGAKGFLGSGAQQKALMEFGQNLGSQEYGTAYNRASTEFNNDRTFKYTDWLNRQKSYDQNLRNKLADLTGMVGYGERSVGRQENAGDNYTREITGVNVNQGNLNAGQAAAPWNFATNVIKSAGNAGSDVINAYAESLPNGSPAPAPVAITPQNTTPTQMVGMTAQGFNPSLYNQMSVPQNVPTLQSPWLRNP